MQQITPPPGFAPMPLDGSFNDAFAPVYIHFDESGPRVGLKVESKHLNPMGICHGAVYMALFDIAFACAIGFKLGKFVGTPTMNINIDYMAAAKENDWLEVDAECLKTTRTTGFTQGRILCDERIMAAGSGLFRIPDDLAKAPGMETEGFSL